MTTLLLIDCQKDFHPGGSLAVPNADKDAERITNFIRQNTSSIHRIVATMDSHHPLHIAKPFFWSDGVTGNVPSPFTVISMEDIVGGKWIPREDIKPSAREPLLIEDAIVMASSSVDGADGGGGGGDVVSRRKEDGWQGGSLIPTDLYSVDDNGNKKLNIKQWCIEYTRRLEANGKFQLMIWPEHCIVGTEGNTLVTTISDAMMEWSRKTGGSVEWVNKGQNLLTEMYSALCAEVPVTKETSFNYELLESVSTIDDMSLLVFLMALSLLAYIFLVYFSHTVLIL
jgi:nicotinamidase/pyrazinamidase